MRQTVFLFDIDGVLVQPGGYRRAVQATLDHFTRRMGLDSQVLSEETVSTFEAHNITSEWDIVPLCLAAILAGFQALYPGVRLPAELYPACDALRAYGVSAPQVDFQALARRLGAAFQQELTFSDLALLLNQPDSQDPPFPHLRGHPLLQALLGGTRDVFTSVTTRTFQQFVLGREMYQAMFALPFEIDGHGDSYLRVYDRPALSAGLRDELLGLWRSGKLHLAVYTLRPSSLRSEVPARALSYAPEADIALKDSGLDGVPLVGFGQVNRLAELTGAALRHIVKPSPIQALGAIGAAVCRDEIQALLAARVWVDQGDSAFFERFPPLDVHIFEDSAGSILGVRRAVELLVGIGVPARLYAWGISQSQAKTAALRSASAEVCEDVDKAVVSALELLG